MDTIQQARALLASEADPYVLDLAEQLVAQERATWVPDPYVENVVGLLQPGSDRAWLVVYLADQDWETSADFEGVRLCQ